jgi:hypothetical protein
MRVVAGGSAFAYTGHTTAITGGPVGIAEPGRQFLF